VGVADVLKLELGHNTPASNWGGVRYGCPQL